MKEHKIDLVKTNSPRRCLNLCLQLGYHYAGVEYGWECFCSNNRPNEVGIVSDDKCNTTCPGDPGQICGGVWRIYAYRTGLDTENKAKHCQLATHPLTIPAQALTTPETPAPTPGIPAPTPGFPAPTPGTPAPTPGIPAPTLENQAPTLENQAPTPANPASTPANTLLPKPEITIPMELGEKEELTLDGNSVTTFNGMKAYKGKVIFEEHFNDASNFQTNWQHDVKVADKPDYEFCVYTANSANSYIYNATLILKPTVLPNKFVRTGNIKVISCTGRPNTDECEFQAKSYHILPPVQCARLNTLESFTFRYGVVEIIAKLPLGDWLVPELWLEPKTKAYGPGYNSGRIRIAVSRGNLDLQINSEDMGCRKLESGVLMSTYQENVRGRTISRETGPDGWYKEFHNYTVVWTPDNLSFLVDGQQQHSLVPLKGMRLSGIVGFSQHESETWATGTPLAPFDKEFYISLGLSAGGVRDFPDNCINRGKPKPWKNLELKATLNFWLDRNNWLPTWNNETAALHIRSVKVTAI